MSSVVAAKEEVSTSAMVIKGVAVGLAVGTAAVVATPAILGLAGFTAAGVAAGSLAAWVQSAVHGGFTFGVFSTLQSIGAAGLGAAGSAVLVGGGAAVGGAVDALAR